MTNDNGNFTVEELGKHIPRQFYETVIVIVNSLPRSAQSVVDAFFKACEIIAPVFREPKPVTIIFGKSPFQIETELSKTTVEFINDTEQLTTDNRIYLSYPNLLQGTFEVQVAVILEELCHHFLNIEDESLVKGVVMALYPEVTFNRTKYESKSAH
jgi:hypothetical protein